MEANVDLISNGLSQGMVANQIANNGRLNLGQMRPFIDADGKPYITTYMGGDPKAATSWKTELITNATATLRRDEWKQLDAAIMEPARFRLGGIQDLIDKGLTFNLGNAMGTTVLEWHDVSDAMEASLTMDGVSRGNGDRPVYQHNYLPIPIVHVDYEINARVLASSRSLGNPLDTTSAERAARKVLEKLEAMLFSDTTYSFGEKDSRSKNTIYSYLNHPDNNLVTLTHSWSAAGTTAAEILADVMNMKTASVDDYHYGPWMLYIPSAYDAKLDEDYGSTGTTNTLTIRDRILKIAGITGIKVVDTLATDHVLLVQMTPDVVRLVRGMGLQNVEWETEGKFVTKYKVLTIQVPQIRSDQNLRSGIVLGTP